MQGKVQRLTVKLVQLKIEEPTEADERQPDAKNFEEADSSRPLMVGNPIQFDLHADEQHEQTIEPDAEVAEQREERIGEHGGKHPADDGYGMDNEPAGHQAAAPADAALFATSAGRFWPLGPVGMPAL
jgi:hypothetical protein